MVENHLTIRNAQDNERSIIRDITVAAYAQYQAAMPPRFWTRYQQNLIAILDGEGNFERIVAEQNGALVGRPLSMNGTKNNAKPRSYFPEIGRGSLQKSQRWSRSWKEGAAQARQVDAHMDLDHA